MDRKLYPRAYARSSAGVFCRDFVRYLDQCNFSPNTADELLEHDPVGYRLMEGVWGKQETILKARAKVAADRAAHKSACGSN